MVEAKKKRPAPGKRGPKRHWRKGDQFLIYHQDESVIVVDKKAGLLSVRTPNGKGDDLIGLLRAHIGTRGRVNPILPVHRLDKVVSGLIVTARNRQAQNQLIQQFKAHTVERRYIAAVEGLIPDDSGTFESRLESQGRSLRMVSVQHHQGLPAVTHWRVLERFEKAEATLVEVKLETGVRNQIRAHFGEAGFPLLGERKYLDADDERQSNIQGNQRIFLHAASLGFAHPQNERMMSWEAPLPPELERWLTDLRKGKKAYRLPSPPRKPGDKKRFGRGPPRGSKAKKRAK